MGFPPLSKVSCFTHETKEKYLSSCMKENIEVISMQQLCMFIKKGFNLQQSTGFD